VNVAHQRVPATREMPLVGVVVVQREGAFGSSGVSDPQLDRRGS
jgi:hypothetical protein